MKDGDNPSSSREIENQEKVLDLDPLVTISSDVTAETITSDKEDDLNEDALVPLTTAPPQRLGLMYPLPSAVFDTTFFLFSLSLISDTHRFQPAIFLGDNFYRHRLADPVSFPGGVYFNFSPQRIAAQNDNLDSNNTKLGVFDGLFADLILKIMEYLDPLSLITFARSSHRSLSLFKTTSFSNKYWCTRFKCHFPHLYEEINKKEAPDWRIEFKSAENKTYHQMIPEARKKFYFVNEGDMNGLRRMGTLDIRDLLCTTIDNRSLIDIAATKRNPDILRYCYNAAIKFYQRDTERIAPKARDRIGHTALHWSAKCGTADVMPKLIKQGCEVGAETTFGRFTALDEACYYGHEECAKVLLAHGAQVNRASRNGSTPLFNAAQRGHLQVVKVLLAAGANPNLAAEDGSTPLTTSVLAHGYLNVVSTLLANGANVNVRMQGSTPLVLAAQENRLDLISVLIDHGADVNLATDSGGTPLFMAAQKGHLRFIEILLKVKGININAAFHTNKAALVSLGERYSSEVKLRLENFIKEKDDPDTITMTASDIAYILGHVEIVNCIHLAKINRLDNRINRLSQ